MATLEVFDRQQNYNTTQFTLSRFKKINKNEIKKQNSKKKIINEINRHLKTY